MIYDCFTFYNELDILEIRLNILNEVVDKFVLVEATKTFNNVNKPLYYEMNKENFKQFSSKIIHVIVDDFPEFENAWDFENHQRNNILQGLGFCKPDDLILISDVDELPNPAFIQNIKPKEKEIVCICLRLYNFYLNYLSIKHPVWRTNSVKFFRYSIFSMPLNEKYVIYNDTLVRSLNAGVTPTKIRLYRNCKYLFNGGWHFSFMGGAEIISQKIKDYSHQEFNDVQHTDVEIINDRVKSGVNVCTGEKEFCAVKIDDYFPEYIREKIDLYSKHIIDVETKNQTSVKIIVAIKTLEGFLRAYAGKIKYLVG